MQLASTAPARRLRQRQPLARGLLSLLVFVGSLLSWHHGLIGHGQHWRGAEGHMSRELAAVWAEAHPTSATSAPPTEIAIEDRDCALCAAASCAASAAVPATVALLDGPHAATPLAPAHALARPALAPRALLRAAPKTSPPV